MKLVRYGALGQEKPGLIDKSGQLRDLSAHVKDLDGEAYAPDSLAKLAGLDISKLPTVDGKPRSGARPPRPPVPSSPACTSRSFPPSTASRGLVRPSPASRNLSRSG